MKYITNKYIICQKIQELEFQNQVIKKVGQESAIIVAPTGSGKTVIALRLAALHLPKGSILYLAPTIVLVEQQYKMFRQNLIQDVQVILITATDKQRVYKFNDAGRKIVFSTPHIISNDLKQQKINLGTTYNFRRNT